ncbi:unnamed protein product [Spirodela intermedia]|uniref:Uncharacterized protein n=1 Tax=Spirodela intermedia TaxID=51605 RepID=A0A7I8J909_SPIIN|nr:unnamed protein product [Spirodela intermedia]CAA6666275.1 unnamed protein product [Spirodela intermedia]
MLPRLAGRQPLKWLLARTITDTGELPKLSGRSKEKRLWLMKMASRSLSKSSRGTFPSNSLNLMSRNLREGRRRTTRGTCRRNGCCSDRARRGASDSQTCAGPCRRSGSS